MRRLLLCILPLVAASVAAAGQPAAEPTTAIVNSYLEIQAHLAADRFDPVKAPARTLAAHAATTKRGDAIAKLAAALEKAPDLEAARDAFGPLSDAVVAYVQEVGGEAADLRLAFCPMVKRSWLQRDAQIRNPYYGSQMSSCGEFKPLKK